MKRWQLRRISSPDSAQCRSTPHGLDDVLGPRLDVRLHGDLALLAEDLNPGAAINLAGGMTDLAHACLDPGSGARRRPPLQTTLGCHDHRTGFPEFVNGVAAALVRITRDTTSLEACWRSTRHLDLSAVLGIRVVAAASDPRASPQYVGNRALDIDGDT
jgi:hypothetical protein